MLAFYHAVSVEDALYLAITVNADMNTTDIIGALLRGCYPLHCRGGVRPSYSAGSVEGALYLAANVKTYTNATYSRDNAARMLRVALLWACTPFLSC